MEFEIDGDLYRRLTLLTNGSPFLLYATLMSVLKICLHKYTGSGTIVVGSPAMLDPKQATTKANAVAIVDAVDEQQSFRQLLLQVRNNLLEAYARQSYPFEILIEDLGWGHTENRCPLFDCALALESIHGDLPGLRNDVTLTLSESPGRLGGLIESNRSLFNGETIERFAGHLTNILRQVLDNTGAQIRQLQILTDAERHHLTVALNDTRVAYPKGKCIHQLIEAQAARTPDAVAVVFGDELLTYRELNARGNQLANHLRALGVGAEVKVGLLIEHSIEMVIGLLGILKAGGAYLPLDPTYPRERLSFMLADSEVPVLLTQQKLVAGLPAHFAQVICLDADCEPLTPESEENLSELASPANLAYVIYTSGSTGKPKGVMITHQGLVNNLTWGADAYCLTDGQGAATHTTIGYD
jgi:non-ribosomal peptide synthetase component F